MNNKNFFIFQNVVENVSKTFEEKKNINAKFTLYKTKYEVEFDLSPQFKDLFIKMVAYNPNERLSIEKIMEHPYMVEISHANQEQFSLYEDNLINELNNIMNL